MRAKSLNLFVAAIMVELAQNLVHLGNVAKLNREYESARSYFQSAVAIQEKLAPNSPDLAQSLVHLGDLAKLNREYESARSYFQRAVAIQKKLAPSSEILSRSLYNLGSLAERQGQLDLAGAYFKSALENRENRESPVMAVMWSSLGRVAEKRGQFELASDYYQRAVNNSASFSLALDNLGLARNLNRIGEESRALGEFESAANFFERAIFALEALISDPVFPPDVKAGYQAASSNAYRNSVETLLQVRRPEAAFAALESSHARAFLAFLSERELFFSEVPESLDRERHRIADLYEHTQAQIEDLNPRDHAEQIDQLTCRLEELRRQYNFKSQEIRRASPKLAALRYPEPLDLEGVRQALDPGTVMLSYSVGGEKANLFVLTRESPLETHPMPIGEEDLRNQLKRFNVHLSSRGGHYARGRFEMAKWLYNTLVEPAAQAIEKSERVLLVADGPLYRLPFAALIRETASEQKGDYERGWQYLVEWKPFHTVLSGTVYAELHKLRRPSAPSSARESPPIALAAFGDPEYPLPFFKSAGAREAIEDIYVRDAAERFDFDPLPHTRSEVETIAGLFRSQPVRTYLGKDATEENAKALGKDVRIVHFATHGYLNDQFPLNTALALTIPDQLVEGGENGFLQVWEIFESVRLDADLVVLSACETADGQEQFGEGLIGLSRAFQFAGARSVLGTLWNVPDRTTAELMIRFYRHLLSGKAFDESLRAAQIELIRGEVKTSSGRPAKEPYYWAAFQVIGDWK